MQNFSKVSIVLPTYNGAKYIRQSIDSCLNQTYENIELIVVDDSSTDETLKIIRFYKDQRIKCIRHEKKKGLPQALNTGFAQATGKYLTWTSDDNYYAEDAIEKMMIFLESNNSSFVYCDFYRFDGKHPANLNVVKLPNVITLEEHNDIRACFLYSRKVKEAVGNYDPDTASAEDYDYWIRVSKKFAMCHLDKPLYFCREHGDSLTAGLGQYHIQTVSILVRLKNNIIDVEKATAQFIELIVNRNRVPIPNALTRLMTLKRIDLSTVYRFLSRICFSREINRILSDFQMKRISFENAKLSLKNTASRRFIRIVPVAASVVFHICKILMKTYRRGKVKKRRFHA